jgi:hypothetical protein
MEEDLTQAYIEKSGRKETRLMKSHSADEQASDKAKSSFAEFRKITEYLWIHLPQIRERRFQHQSSEI